MKFDLHIHSEHSVDCKSKVSSIISRAKKTGLNCIAIVDHNSFKGSAEAMSMDPEGIIIIPGAEYSTDEGHFLVYFLKEGIEEKGLPRDSSGRFHWRDVIAAAHEQQALVFLAHPFKQLKKHNYEIWEQLDGIEIFNGRAALSRNKNANIQARDMAEVKNKAFSAGSDAHWLGEIGYTFLEYCFINENEINSLAAKDEQLDIIKNAILSGNGRVWGAASSYFYEPASQIHKALKMFSYKKLFKSILKIIRACILEFAGYIGIYKKPKPNWMVINRKEGV